MTTVATLARARTICALAVITIVLAGPGCNQRTPVLDAEPAITAPSAILPPAPSDIARMVFAPPGNRGGAAGVGTVYLDSPAPDGGLVVVLQSGDESTVTVSPRQLVVPAGALSADFQFTTRSVLRDVNVTITAASANRSISDYVSVWTPTTSFISYAADRSGFASPPVVRWSSDAGARFEASCLGSYAYGTVTAPGSLPLIFRFGAPQGQPLRPGTYDDVTDSERGNNMVVSGAGNCGSTGRFKVHEIETRADGTLSSLWVTFELGCRAKPGVMRGAFRILNATPRTPAHQCVR